MSMINFRQEMQNQLDKMVSTGTLYVSMVPKDKIWETYLASFSKESNPTFRDPSSSYKNCNTKVYTKNY